uniref:Uncharacterized protein n=1 Tax=Arundo donax TaxID=35708 RepID=A0A0A9AU95_ARUDO
MVSEIVSFSKIINSDLQTGHAHRKIIQHVQGSIVDNNKKTSSKI